MNRLFIAIIFFAGFLNNYLLAAAASASAAALSQYSCSCQNGSFVCCSKSNSSQCSTVAPTCEGVNNSAITGDSCIDQTAAQGADCTTTVMNSMQNYQLLGKCQQATGGSLVCGTCTGSQANAECKVQKKASAGTSVNLSGTCRAGEKGIFYCATCTAGNKVGDNCQLTTIDEKNNSIAVTGTCQDLNGILMCEQGTSGMLNAASSSSSGCNNLSGSCGTLAALMLLFGGLLMANRSKKKV